MITLASTAIPIDSKIPAIPGSVSCTQGNIERMNTYVTAKNTKAKDAATPSNLYLAIKITKISKNISIPVRQLTLNREPIAEFDSTKSAGELVGIDSSCIVKCCKGKRTTAGGFRWEYVNISTISENIDPTIWIGTGEAVQLVGHNRNVLYYHMDIIKDIPYKKDGRKRYIHKPTLLKIFINQSY